MGISLKINPVELYHLLNRGVEKRNIFMSDDDRVRFVHSLYEFNSTHPANNTRWNLTHSLPAQNNDLRGRYSGRLVDIHGWCLMDNHYHLLVSGRAEKGLSKFIMKLNVGYAKYFNEKYKRSGALFQGRTKKVLVQRDSHFQYILHYIHLNPLDFSKESSSWREGVLRSANAAIQHLEKYRWSSYVDYCGRRNFPSILTKQLFSEADGDYEKVLKKYLHDLQADPATNPNLE